MVIWVDESFEVKFMLDRTDRAESHRVNHHRACRRPNRLHPVASVTKTIGKLLKFDERANQPLLLEDSDLSLPSGLAFGFQHPA